LLELDDLSNEQRTTFSRFVEYIKSSDRQNEILAAGYRPTDLSIPLDAPGSPFTAANGVDATQPQTALQMPAPSVVQVVRDVWWYTKRHTNVYLVVDVSGSMEGSKLNNAQQALQVFLDQIRGDVERVGLITFSTTVDQAVPLDELSRNRGILLDEINQLQAYGDTSLLDAVDQAYAELRSLQDVERINAIVVMTDGRENNSSVRLDTLTERIRRGNQQDTPIVIFCIGYGSDADEGTLRILAESSGGQYYTGDLDTIRRLYKILSAYF
jgi:Ca-activated chloride channel family protein